MTRTVTGLCVAAAFGCIATLGAQTSTTATTEQRTAMSEKLRDITVTGCLSKAADGKFMLTNARMEEPTSATTTAGTSTSTGTSTAGTSAAGTTTAGTTAGTSTSTSSTAGRMAAMNHPAATAWMLSGGNDLEKHVGHKIQVVGRSSWDTNSMDHRGTPDTTAAAGTSSAAGTVGTSGSTATAATEEQRKDMRTEQPRLDVQSIKMIASSCS